MAPRKTGTATAASASPDLWAPGARTIHTPIPLGVYEDGSTAQLALWNSIGARHTFLTGATGSGKTTSLNVLLTGTMASVDTVVWVIDVAKRGKSLAPWLPCIDWLATDPATAVDMLTCANAVIDARALAGARLAATGDGDAVLAPSPDLPLLLIVIDEASALFGRNTPEAQEATEQATQVAETGREVAVGSIVATQKPTQDSLGHSGRLKSQLNPVLCLRMNRLGDLRWAMTSAPAESLTLDVYTAPGVTLMQDGPEASPLPLRGYPLYDPATVAKLARLYAPHRPPLDTASAQAAGDMYATRNRDPLGIGGDSEPGKRRPSPHPATGRPSPKHSTAASARQAFQTARTQALKLIADAETAPPLSAQPLETLTAKVPAQPWPADPAATELVLDVLGKATGQLSRAEIQLATNVSKATVCRVLANLALQGHVTRTRDKGRQLYQLNTASESHAA